MVAPYIMHQVPVSLRFTPVRDLRSPTLDDRRSSGGNLSERHSDSALDIENALRQDHVKGHLDEIDKKILKLEKQMDDIKEVVDTTNIGRCCGCIGSLINIGFTTLMIYVAVKVLSN
jgi:hypothetical protein